MIDVTGDCHGDFSRFCEERFWGQSDMTNDDYVIICGDFGGVWRQETDAKEENNLDWLESRSWTTLFVDGNHENLNRLYAYPMGEWYGDKIHRIRSSMIHLMRGQIFEIEGKTIFAFGGASSHDIQGGILNLDAPDFEVKRMRLSNGYLPYRTKNLDWWECELPSKEEM